MLKIFSSALCNQNCSIWQKYTRSDSSSAHGHDHMSWSSPAHLTAGNTTRPTHSNQRPLCVWRGNRSWSETIKVICNLNIWFFHIFVVISKRCIFQETHQNFPRLDFPFTLCVRGTLTKEKRQNSLEWREERGEREEVTGGTDGRRKEALRILMN